MTTTLSQRRLVAWALFLAVAMAQPAKRGVNVPQAASADAPNGSYYALVIGINQYRRPLPDLKTAVDDAKAVAKVLSEHYGFQVKQLLDANATRSKILDSINQYRRSLRENDNLLIYYAGHGHSDAEADKAYWLPSDAEADSNSNWIIADELTTDIRVQPARHVLIVSDSCYSGGLTRELNAQVRPDDQKVYLRKMLASRSRTLMASGGNEPVADSGEGGHSVFANAVLGALERISADTFAAGDLFHDFVRQQVAGRSDQIPRYSFIRNSNHDNGDFVFVRREAPLAPKQRLSLFRLGQIFSTPVWEELKGSPPGVVALVAHGASLVAADGSPRVHRSVDGGAHWTASAIADFEANISTLASCGSLLFAGIRNQRWIAGAAVFVSRDNGVTWLPTSLKGDRVAALSCSGGTILAGLWVANEKSTHPALVVSADSGNSWAISREPFHAQSVAVTDFRLEALGNDSDVADGFGSNYCANLLGWTCSPVNAKSSFLAFPTTLQRSGGAVYVGTTALSVMVSFTDGKNWTEALLRQNALEPWTLKIPSGAVTAMTVTDQYVIAGTRAQGVFAHSEISFGDTWSLVGDQVLPELSSLTYDGTFLYAGNSGKGNHVYRIRFPN